LSRVGDAYVAALRARDITRLPGAAQATYVENGVAIAAGSGVWRTATRVEPLFRTFDEHAQSLALFALIEEGARPALLWTYLSAEGGRVRVVETGVARRESATFLKPAGFMARADAFDAPLPPEARRSRAALLDVARAYLFSLTDGGAPAPPFSQACDRVENGLQSTNTLNPDPPLSAGFTSMGCLEQFTSGSLKFVSGVRDLRFRVVDEARGLVFATLVFDHDGLARQARDEARLSSALPSPYSFTVGELFKIDGDGIVRVEAVLVLAPFGLSTPGCLSARGVTDC
jgi:hypothetical protein